MNGAVGAAYAELTSGEYFIIKKGKSQDTKKAKNRDYFTNLFCDY